MTPYLGLFTILDFFDFTRAKLGYKGGALRSHTQPPASVQMTVVNGTKKLSVLIKNVNTVVVTVPYQDPTLAVCRKTNWSK